MARTKEFEPGEALEAATRAFWQLGFERTSLDDLMRKMGVARQSLYDTFGGKRSLYLKVLAHYRDTNHAYLRGVLEREKSVKDGFSRILDDLCRQSRKEHERGCLLLSANIEFASRDEEIAALLREDQQEIENIFRAALKRARKRGEIGKDKQPASLARFFAATIQGLKATARLSHDRAQLRDIADAALSVLN
jgi:TetR/AcrR family transcriptional repressor of nem operon